VQGGAAKRPWWRPASIGEARAASSQELDNGDGAAAFVVTAEGGAAEFLGRGSVTDDFVDHFRGRQRLRLRLGGALDPRRGHRQAGPAGHPPSAGGFRPKRFRRRAFLLPVDLRRHGRQLGQDGRDRPEAVRDNLPLTLGEVGCAHGPLMLAHALEQAKPGEVILVAQFGQGAEALVFRVGDGVAEARPARGVTGSLADRKEELNYLKFLTFNGLVEWDKGMRAEKDNKTALTTLYRNQDMILGLVGGRCRETGVVQFPRTRISVAPNNPGVDTQEPYRFAERKASVLSYSADYLTFSMSPPNHYGMIVFEGGGRIMMDITDVEQGEVDSGLPVKMVFRIKDVDEKRGFVRYFWKAAPDRAAMAGPPWRRNRRTIMAKGIRDKVAILGMGCSKFGERWDAGPTT
jgi:uncharacterized OB-fold protein